MMAVKLSPCWKNMGLLSCVVLMEVCLKVPAYEGFEIWFAGCT